MITWANIAIDLLHSGHTWDAEYVLASTVIARLSYDEATTLLELPKEWKMSDLKTAYRNVSRKYHPDLGGDTETMKLINEAYKMLQKSGGHIQEREDQDADDKAAAKIINASLDATLDTEAIKKHLENATGKQFSVDVKNRVNRYYVGRTVEWKSKDEETIFNLDVSVLLSGFSRQRSLGGGKDVFSFPVTLNTKIFHNNRKSKFKQRDWDQTQDVKKLKAEDLFPAAKIKKMLGGKDKARKFSRRDMYLALQKKLGATTDKEWAYIPYGDYQLRMYRTVIMKYAAWTIHSVRDSSDPKNTVKPAKYETLPEQEKLIDVLFAAQKKKWNDPKRLIDFIQRGAKYEPSK